MADLARMRFTSERFPEGEGALVLADDGRFHVEVSEAMLETIAVREQAIVEGAWRAAVIAAAGCALLGAASLAAGWAAGRIGGRLRERYTNWRPVSEAKACYDASTGLSLQFKAGTLQQATLTWKPGEYQDAEAKRFYDEARRLQSNNEFRGR